MATSKTISARRKTSSTTASTKRAKTTGGGKRVALYVRVSTNDQTVANQLGVLNETAKRAGWDVIEVYADEGFSGAKGRNERPAFDAMLKAATRREFDMIATVALDRIGRSMKHLVEFIETIKALGVGLYIHDQALDTSTPAGELFFHIAGAFASFERSLIRERVKSSIARRRAEGKQVGGRPVGWRKPKRTHADAVIKLHKAGVSMRQIAATVGIAKSTVQVIVKEARDPSKAG